MPADQRAILRRAAWIQIYRNEYQRFAREQQLIKTKYGTVVHFELYPAQKLIESVIEEQLKTAGWIRLLEFKARQHGGSTHGVSRACHRAFMHENVSALILAQDDTTASNLFDMAQLMYESMHEGIRPVRRYLNKQEIVLENPDVKTRPEFPGLRSRITIQSAKNLHAGVGTTRNWLHISEMCRFGKVKELMGSLVPAIPLLPGTAVINESAPFGYGEGRDAFRQACDAARSGKAIDKFVGVYWWMIPEYQLPLRPEDLDRGKFRPTIEERRLIKHIEMVSRKELGREHSLSAEQLKYRRVRIMELGRGDDTVGEQLFMQQFPHDYESGWITFVNLVFAPYTIATMRKQYERGPLYRCDVIDGGNGNEIVPVQHDAPLWLWSKPEPGEIYDMGVDSSSGTGGNASAFHVFQRSNNEQVAEYQNNKIGPLDYAKIVYAVGLYFNAAHVGVEVEGIGYAVNEALNQMGYPNIYRWRKRDHAGGGILSPLTGWKTQFDTKRLLVAVAQDNIEHDRVIIHSTRLYNELRYFCQDLTEMGNETFYASEGDDDLSMAFMIAQVIQRDEKFMDLPMEEGGRFTGTMTLDERNNRMQEGIAKSHSLMDIPDKETGPYYSPDQLKAFRDGHLSGTMIERLEDPWEKLQKAMKDNKGEFDA